FFHRSAVVGHKGNQHYVVLKIEMEKAYDRRYFLFPPLHSLGFAPECICWIYTCLSSSTLTIFINGLHLICAMLRRTLKVDS
ncbi:hypothetical protein LINPERPRIM_LOCUS39263, partial [Linum perenne]